MLQWIQKQWNDIKGNVKYGFLVSVPFIAGVITRGLAWWQQAILALLCVCVVAWAVVQTLKADRLVQSRQQAEKQDEHLPAVTVKDSDPKIYVEFKDDRYLTGPGFSGEKNVRFVLVNRGLAYAKFVCLDHIRLREEIIKFSEFAESLGPRESIGFHPAIERYDAKDSAGCDVFRALFGEWNALNNPNIPELAVPLRVTYQDDAKNLYEATCDLVFDHDEHLKVRMQGQQGSTKVAETRNHQFRKVAIAVSLLPRH